MADTPLSSRIYLSRDSIREQISDEIKYYLDLENVDLTKSSFLSFLIDTMATLTSNLLFYNLSTYREFFLTKAQIPDSILNLSAFLGYNTQEAQYSQVNVLITVPFGFEDSSTTFTLPEGFKFTAEGNIEFRTYYETTIKVENNANVTITVVEENKKYSLPINLETSYFQFVLPLRQIKTVSQEFQIDSDLQSFQFSTLDVPISGEVASLTVKIQPPNSASITTWDEFDSLFLMSDTDEGYVSRRTDSGRRISFGNGLIGVQPEPGSTVYVDAEVTEGVEGNVIAGSIRTGERIYLTTLAGVNQIVDYTVINNSPAFGGEDEESLEEIRRNAIASITTLSRLVTENDYQNINVIAPDLPLAQNALAVLKRSDLQVNEICLFSGLIFGSETDEVDNIVPTRNAVFTLPAGTTRLARDTTITIGDDIFYNIFDIDIQLLNSVGLYRYIVKEIEVTPAIETSYSSSYDIFSDKLEVTKSGSQGIFRLHYQSGESDAGSASCQMVIQSSGSTKNMTNDSTSGYFVYTFDPYTDIPLGEQTFEFTISTPGSDPVVKYSNKITFREDISDFMRSNVVADGTSIIVYDVPVIEKTYYDEISQKDFELEVLQIVATQFDLTDSRMLTDFVNAKFTNTWGVMSAMQLNDPNKTPVIDFVTSLPTGCDIGDRFILLDETSDRHNNYIRCSDSSAAIFTYEEPLGDDIVYVTNKGVKYIFAEKGWITIPYYTMPLEIEIEVFRETTYSGTIVTMANLVRETIYEAFKSRFGTNAEIYRSEIVDIVQEIDGVSHCRLRKPLTSIFFNFNLDNLTEAQLLRYGPEYVFFKEENITVKVI